MSVFRAFILAAAIAAPATVSQAQDIITNPRHQPRTESPTRNVATHCPVSGRVSLLVCEDLGSTRHTYLPIKQPKRYITLER